MPNQSKHILLAAGGTGGHVYPAIAIADAFKRLRPDWSVSFVGTRSNMEWKAVPKAGYEIDPIWISGFQRKLTMANILFPLKLVTSLAQCVSILGKRKPAAVVCTGGFVSGPVGFVADKKGIPVFVQEQNSFPGVANRLLVKHAKTMYTAFEEAKKYLSHNDIRNYGNPVRSTMDVIERAEGIKEFGFDPNKAVLLVLGGSLGARGINQAIEKNLSKLHDDLGIQIIWQTGKLYYDDLKSRIPVESYPNLRMKAYLDVMPQAYAAAHLVVSRAGASTISEIENLGKASILMPSPNVAGDHQRHNARSLAKHDAAVLLEDNDAEKDLVSLVQQILSNKKRVIELEQNAKKLARTDAATRIASEIIERLEENK